MPSSTAANPVWPSPGRFALGLGLGFALTLTAAWLWGVALVEALLPLAHVLLGWIDERFGILLLGVEHNWQDTVVRLRVTPISMFVIGGQVIEAQPQGWLEVTTTIGAMLQTLIIASAIAIALPGAPRRRMLAFMLAALLAAGFLIVDLPLTLHAYVWDMFVDNLEPDRFSPLLAWHEFLHAGGRLGVAVILGLAGWLLAGKARAAAQGHRQNHCEYNFSLSPLGSFGGELGHLQPSRPIRSLSCVQPLGDGSKIRGYLHANS